jgi:hypothetical protein
MLEPGREEENRSLPEESANALGFFLVVAFQQQFFGNSVRFRPTLDTDVTHSRTLAGVE